MLRLKKSKRIASMLMAIGLVLSCSSGVVFAQETLNKGKEIRLVVGGKALDLGNTKPYINQYDSIRIPVVSVSKAVGINVGWDNSTGKITLKKNNDTVVLETRAKKGFESYFYKNGERVHGESVEVVNGTSYFGLSILDKAFDYNIQWSPYKKEISIRTKEDTTTNSNSNIKCLGDYKSGKFNADNISVEDINNTYYSDAYSWGIELNSKLKIEGFVAKPTSKNSNVLQVFVSSSDNENYTKQISQITPILKQDLSDNTVNEIINYTKSNDRGAKDKTIKTDKYVIDLYKTFGSTGITIKRK